MHGHRRTFKSVACEWESEWEEEKKETKAAKNRWTSTFPPLISGMYNIKAITCRLCQHVWNNTLVTDGEMKRGRRKSEDEGLWGWNAPSAGTKTCCCSNKYKGGDDNLSISALFLLIFARLARRTYLLTYFWHPQNCNIYMRPQSKNTSLPWPHISQQMR